MSKMSWRRRRRSSAQSYSRVTALSLTPSLVASCATATASPKAAQSPLTVIVASMMVTRAPPGEMGGYGGGVGGEGGGEDGLGGGSGGDDGDADGGSVGGGSVGGCEGTGGAAITVPSSWHSPATGWTAFTKASHGGVAPKPDHLHEHCGAGGGDGDAEGGGEGDAEGGGGVGDGDVGGGGGGR